MGNEHFKLIHKYDFLTKEFLEEQYIKNDLNDSEIAKKYNISSKAVVWEKRKFFNIENKFKGKSNQNATINRKFKISKIDAEKLLEEGKTFDEISKIMGCSIIVAKRRFKELGLTKKQNQVEHYLFYNIELTEEQKQLIIGSTLGDGSICHSGSYSCTHSIKQREYFDHKRNILNNIHSNIVHQYTHDYPYLSEPTESVHFTTGCNKYLYEMRNIYYPNGIKIFPYEFIFNNMTPLGLSYWYCDDGGRNVKNASIYTYGYSYEEHEKMLYLFKEKFGLEAAIKTDNARKIHKHHVHFNVENSRKFFDLISSYIVPTMKYKIV